MHHEWRRKHEAQRDNVIVTSTILIAPCAFETGSDSGGRQRFVPAELADQPPNVRIGDGSGGARGVVASCKAPLGAAVQRPERSQRGKANQQEACATWRQSP